MRKIKTSHNLLENLNEYFESQFRRLGIAIGKHPWYFIIIPIIIAFLCGAGLHRFEYVNDPEYLFPPLNGQARDDRRKIEEYFPMNYSNHFDPSRLLRTTGFARIWILAKDRGNLIRTEIWKEIKELDHFIQSIEVVHHNKTFNYSTLSAKYEGEPFANDLLDLVDMMPQIEAGNMSLTYPIMINTGTFKPYVFPIFLGGIELSNSTTIKTAKGYVLIYFANVDSPDDQQRGYKWEGALLDGLTKMDNHWEHIEVFRLTWRSVAEEIDENTWASLRIVPLAATLMIIFTVGSMMSTDMLRAKPWLGCVGMGATVLGTIAGFGLVCWFRVPVVNMLIAGFFLNLGIGIDDSFVMIAAWRRTSPQDPVTKRMGDAYAEAAVSITITSLTDMFSFWVGVAAPFNFVRIFCLYTGTAVVFTYLFHVTIFGAAMALNGYHEADGRHGIFFWKKIARQVTFTTNDSNVNNNQQKSFEQQSQNELTEAQDFGLMKFFRNYWAYYLNKPVVKMIVIVLFIIYLCVSGWGISRMKEQFSLSNITIPGSYAYNYFEVENEYFRKYPHRIQVMVTGDIEYSDKKVQERIEGLMSRLEGSRFVGPNGALYSESWLRGFLAHAKSLEEAELPLNFTTEKSFIQELEDNYLSFTSVFVDDIKFNEDKTKIIASRFIIQSTDIFDSNDETAMVEDLRSIAKKEAPHLNVTVFNHYFIYFDQFLIIRSTTIQSIVVTALIMVVISFIFIPNPLCSLWVTFSILTTVIGVSGFLSLWNVNLDGIFMLGVVMSIGMSVDFSVHITYAYLSSKAKTPAERLEACLVSVGTAIVQGAMSTILGIISVFLVPSYILWTFGKAIVLVMVISAAHGIIILPVFLSIFGPGSCKQLDEDYDDEPVIQGTYKMYQGFDNTVFVPDEKKPSSQKEQHRF